MKSSRTDMSVLRCTSAYMYWYVTYQYVPILVWLVCMILSSWYTCMHYCHGQWLTVITAWKVHTCIYSLLLRLVQWRIFWRFVQATPVRTCVYDMLQSVYSASHSQQKCKKLQRVFSCAYCLEYKAVRTAEYAPQLLETTLPVAS
jgi:hypothetical protein